MKKKLKTKDALKYDKILHDLSRTQVTSNISNLNEKNVFKEVVDE